MVEKVYFRKKLTDYNVKMNIINGITAIITLNIVNPYYAKFAERLGASDYHIAYLSSLPALISVFALIPGAMLIEGFRNKKVATTSILFVHKLFYLTLAFVPFTSQKYQPLLFVILVGIMNFPGSISSIGFQSSIGDIFNEKERGISMGLRNRYSAIFGMITTLLSGQMLSRLPKTNTQTIVLYQVFFIIAFIFGMGEVFSYFKFRGISNKKSGSSSAYFDSLKETFASLPKEKDFLIFMGCSLIFYFGWQMGWPLFSIYSIKYLNANELWLGAISIASSLSSIIAYILWAKFADRKGNGWPLSIATFGMAITPLLYAISKSLIALVVFNIVIGVSIAGTTLILFNLLLEVTPKKNRTIYIALYNTFISISATVAPVIGVSVQKRYSIYVALVVVAFLRLAGSIAFFIRNRWVQR